VFEKSQDEGQFCKIILMFIVALGFLAKNLIPNLPGMKK
jgi:hypothetical protein